MCWFPYSLLLTLAYLLDSSLNYGQPSATLWQDQLFVATASPHSLLYRGPFSPATKGVRSPVEYLVSLPGDYAESQAKIQIRDDRVLSYSGGGAYAIIPMQDLPMLEDNLFGDKLRDPRLGPARAADRPNNDPESIQYHAYARYTNIIVHYAAGYERLLFPDHRKHDIEVTDTGRDDGDTPSKRNYWRAARYDVLIHGPKSVWLFHAYKDKLFVSVELDYLNVWYFDKKGNVAKDIPKPPDRQLRTGKLPADFTEPFAAYESGTRYYLVTPNGKAYLVDPKGKTELAVSVVWNDPTRKIVGVVKDIANDAVYGWGYVTDRHSSQRFGVRLDPKPVAVAYKLTVPQWEDRSDAYLESYECARVFRNSMEKK